MSQAATNPNYDPEFAKSATSFISSRLAKFDTIRARFFSIKGTLCGLAFIGIAVSALMILDGCRFLSDHWRWNLSLLSYTMAFGVAWQCGLRSIFQRLSQVNLAADMERLCPRLGERLLSSVELRSSTNPVHLGSEVFVKAIETETANELADIEIPGLLPWNRIRNLQWGVLIGFVSLIGLCFVPSLQFGQRLKRALLPYVDIAAPSVWTIHVLSPEQSYSQAPSEQYVLFSVQVDSIRKSFLNPDTAVLEVRERDTKAITGWGTIKQIPLQADSAAPMRFSTTAPIGRELLQYRFIVEDASTTFREIQPLERPAVETYRWTVSLPSYAESEPLVIEGIQGDVTALRGSQLRLAVTANQNLRSATIVLDQDRGEEPVSIPMRPDSPETNTWQADVPVSTEARFQLKLESLTEHKGEPIRNTFCPWHAIHFVEDGVPIVKWGVDESSLWREPPQGHEFWFVQESDVVSLPCVIKDNLPIQSCWCESSVNDAAWSVMQGSEKQSWDRQPDEDAFIAKSRFQWDVLDAKLNQGDTISIRWAVKDRADQTSYSSPVRLSLADAEFARDRHAALKLKSQLVVPLQELSDHMNGQKKEIESYLKELSQSKLEESAPSETTKAIAKWIETTAALVSKIEETGRTILPQLDQYIDQFDVELILRCCSKIKREQLVPLGFVISTDFVQAKRDAQDNAWFQKYAKEKHDRAQETLNTSTDLARRLHDVYRNWMGLWVQTAMTKDMTHLKHFQSQALENSGNDFDRLKRSQTVSMRYWEAIQKLGREMTPFVNPVFASRLPEWERRVEESRGQIMDLCDPENPAASSQSLRQRVARDVEELKSNRWLFHQDGGLLWNAEQDRRDLTRRQLNLNVYQDRLIHLQRHLREAEAKELSSQETALRRRWHEKEATLFFAFPFEHLADCKDLHLLRQKQDPMYAADMGLAWRAFEFVWDSWQAEGLPIGQKAKDLESVIEATKVLDAFHEIVDARMGLQTLMEQERIQFRSLVGQLDHFRHWQSMGHRIEWAHTKLRDAKFPNGLYDEYHALRWKEPFYRAENKIRMRVEPNDPILASAASEMEELLSQWRVIDLKAAATVEEARDRLRKFAPTISELALAADKKLQQLQELTNSLDPEQTAPNPEAIRGAMAAQKNEVENATQKLQQALIEQANAQNLLKAEERQRAQLSDQAVNLLAETLPEMSQTVDQLLAEEKPQSQSTKDAIESEQNLSKSLQAIAEHFDPNRQSETSLDSLMSESQSNEADYNQAKQLEEFAQQDTQQMLNRLEKELQSDPVMRDELGRLSRDNESSASQELKALAETERQLGLKLENESPSFVEAKRAKAQRLRAVANQVDRVAVPTLQKSVQLAARQNASDKKETLEKAVQNLRAAASEAGQANESVSDDDMNAAAKKLQAAMEAVRDDIAAIAETTKPQISVDPNDKRKQEDRVNDAKKLQASFQTDSHQALKNLTKQWNDEANRQKQRGQNLARDWEQAKKNRDKLQNDLEKRPDDMGTAEAVKRATIDVEQKLQTKQAAEVTQATVQKLSEQFSQQSERMNQRPLANLDQPNSLAALSVDQLERVQEAITSASELMESAFESNSVQPENREQVIRDVAKQQAQVNQAVDRIAQEIQRSGRHEKRLGNEAKVQQSQESSEAIAKASQQVLQSTAKQLNKSADAALAKEKQFAEERLRQEVDQPLPRNQSNGDIQNTRQASQALKALSQSLSANESQAASSTNQASQGSDMQQSMDKARMLDTLDRALFDSAQGTSSQSNQNQSTPNQNSVQSSLQSSANQIASRLNQERLQSMQQSQQSSNSEKRGGNQSASRSSDPNQAFDVNSYFLPNGSVSNQSDWGKLRQQSAEQAVEGKRESLDPEFDQAIQAYFRSIQTATSRK